MEYYTRDNRVLFICYKGTDIPVCRAYSSWCRSDIYCLPDNKSKEEWEKILIQVQFGLFVVPANGGKLNF